MTGLAMRVLFCGESVGSLQQNSNLNDKGEQGLKPVDVAFDVAVQKRQHGAAGLVGTPDT